MRSALRTVTASGAASPQTCWERYAELARWSRWAPQIVGVDAPAARLEVGLSGVVRLTGGLRVPFTVTEVDPAAMTWSWIARPGPLRLDLHHCVRGDPLGSRATLTVAGPAWFVAAYAPLARLALRRLVSERETGAR